MADNIIRAAIFRVGSRRVADVPEVTFAGDSNNKALFGATGYLGHSDGATVTKFSCKQMIQVKGADVDLVGLVLGKTRVRMEFFAGGKNYEIPNAVPMSFSIDSTTEDGSLMGSFEYEGGVPTVV